MSDMFHGVVYVDGKLVFLEEGTYYSPSVVNEETSEARPLCPIPTLELTPEEAEKRRKQCLADTLVYETLTRQGKPCPEYPGRERAAHPPVPKIINPPRERDRPPFYP
jgi:hypothetical protein